MANSGHELTRVLDPGLERLHRDLKSLSLTFNAMRSTQIPVAAVHTVDHAHHHAVSLHKAIQAVPTQHPAKPLLLRSFAQLANGLVLYERALRAKRHTKASSLSRKAETEFRRSAHTFLQADHALGCHYGCEPVSAPPKAIRL